MKKYMKFLLILIIFAGCQDGINNYYEPPETTIRNAPDSVTVSGTTFILSSNLYRDFMPMINPGTNGLIAAAYLETANRTPIDNSLKLNRIYIVKRNMIWESPFSAPANTDVNYKIGGIMRNGPVWETGIHVDVVVSFVFKGGEYFIKAPNQLINRTD